MPTAMTYAIETILRLCEENTRLKCGQTNFVVAPPTASANQPDLSCIATEDDEWQILHGIEVSTIANYLAEEHGYHIYTHDEAPNVVDVNGEPVNAKEAFKRLSESADLIAESQQKQINLLLQDKRDRMDDRERLVKELEALKEFSAGQTKQLHQLADAMLETKVQLKNASGGGVIKQAGRPPRTQLSPCMADPEKVPSHSDKWGNTHYTDGTVSRD